MGVRVQIGEFPFEASDYAVEEWATPLAAGDSSGSVGRLSFTLPQPNLDLIGTPETAYTEWVPQATNLATNPSFETVTPDSAVVRTNLCPRPHPSSTLSTTGWGGLNLSANSVGGVWTTPITTSTPYLFSPGAIGGATQGTTYTLSALVTMEDLVPGHPVTHLTIRAHRRVPNTYFTPAVVLPWEAGATRRVEVTWTATQTIPEADSFDLSIVSPVGNVANMVRFAADEVLIEARPGPAGPFFDGSTGSPDPDLTASWTGAANASTSILSGTRPAAPPHSQQQCVAIRSTQWSSSGGSSVRVISTNVSGNNSTYYSTLAQLGMQTGKTYTVVTTARLAAPQVGSLHARARSLSLNVGGVLSQAPNAAGEYPLRVTFTVDGTTITTAATLSLYNGAMAGNGDVWFDDLLIVEGNYSGPYFDGNTPNPSDTTRYEWNGPENASTSSYETRSSYVQGYTYRDTGWKLIRDFGPDALLDLPVRLTDSYKGFTVGTVTGVQRMDDAGTLQVTCSSRLASLNAYGVQAQPFIGTLEDAFKYYLSLADIVTDLFVDEDISTRFVIFPGWTGELWYHLKEMAAAQDCDIALVSGIILLRPIRERIATRGSDISRSRDMPTPTLAQSVEVYLYNNREIVDELVYPPGGWTPEVEVLNVNAGETVQYTLDLSASVSSIVPPTMETWVEEENSWDSVYTIVANDGLPVKPSLWASNGGSLTVTINPDTTSLTVTLTGAKDIPTTSGTAATNFSVALASDTTGNRYSTLRILGTGVGFHKEKKRVRTGVPAIRTGTEVGVTIDNPFISTVNDLYRTGTRAAKQFAGLAPTLSGSVKAINRRGDSGNADYPTYGEVEEALYTELDTPTYGDVQSYYVSTLNLPTYGDIQDYWFDLVKSSVTNQVFGNVNGARIYDLRSRRWYRIRQGSTNPDRITFEADDDLTNGDVEEFHLGRNYGDVQALFQGRTYKQVHLAGMYGG